MIRRIVCLIGVLVVCVPSATAVQFGAGTGTGYPAAIDTVNTRTNYGGGTCSSATTDNDCAEWNNDVQGAVTAIQSELGTTPKGTSASVKEKIAGLRTYSGATPDTINIVGTQVGIGTATPATSALLDLSSTTGAFLIPRMTTAQKTALTAVNGMMVYDTTLAQYQLYEAGAWRGLGVSSAAPTDAGYWTDTANATLTAERNLGALTTGLVLNTVTAGVGVPSAYGGTLCTNQFPRSLNASGAATCASVSLTADVTGDLPYANLVQATAASKLVGRGSAAGAGDFEEITLGSGLTMTGTTMSSTGGSAPSGGTHTIATEENTTSTTYTDLATVGPTTTLTIGPSGILIVSWRAQVRNNTATSTALISFALSGGNTLAANDARAIMKTEMASAVNYETRAMTYMVTGLAAASTTVTLKYRVTVNTLDAMDRHLWVMTW